MNNKEKIKTVFTLFITFLKIGAFTFGGGYAMISLLQNEFVEKKKWIDKNEFIDITAIAESTPGPIAINSATYIGYKMAGVWGSIISTIGIVLPSFTIIYIISLFFEEFLKIKYVSYAFKGIQAAVIYLILSAGIKMLKGLDKSKFNTILFCCVFLSLLALSFVGIGFSSIYFILACGAVGIIAYLVNKEKGGENK